MLKRRPELYFVSILISIDRIRRNTKDTSYEMFVSDENKFGSVIRSLQEIGESVRKLIDIYDLEKKSLGEGDWRKIVDFRNFIVHKYFGTEPEIIYSVSIDEVPVLEKQVLDILKKIENKKYILQAIEMTIPIYDKMKQMQTVAYLNKILKELSVT